MSALADPYARAEGLLDLGRPEESERELRGLLASAPTDAYAHTLLARALLLQERYDEAESSARSALARDPELDDALLLLASAQAELGDHATAERTITQAIALAPEEALYHELHAGILLELERSEDALAAAERARSLAPDTAGPHAISALALALLGRHDEAERAARQALALDPENEAAHAALGLLGLQQGRGAQAIESYREMLRLDPTADHAREGLATALRTRYPLFGQFLRFLLWQSRLPSGVQWGIAFAPAIAIKVAGTQREAVWFGPLVIALVAVLVLTWAAQPLTTLALLATREGRNVLDPDSRRAGLLFAGFAVTALGCLGGTFVLVDQLFGLALATAIFALAIGSYDSLPERRRPLMLKLAGLVAGCVPALLLLAAAGADAGAVFVPVIPAFVIAVGSLWYVRLAQG